MQGVTETASQVTILADAASVRVQLCLSPHCSTVASLLEVASPNWWEADPKGWQRVFEERARGVDFAALAPYTAYPAVPRFLTSALDNPAPTFASQLDEIRSTPDARVRAEIQETFGDNVPRAYLPFLTSPHRSLERLCASLEQYWDQVVAPCWSQMRVTLEREVLRMAYALATATPEAAVGQAHPAMSFANDRLTINSIVQNDTAELGPRTLMLTPLICAPDGLIADMYAHDRIKVGYAAPGAQDVWAAPDEDPPDANQLTALLGSKRARLLTAIDRPITTSVLSAELHLPLATVSEHLTALHGLGLLTRSRAGRTVEYSLTDLGANLLRIFDTP
jgi:DNA-binding transcriptional ArsR family regulator